jgi:PEP-CTERM motif
MTLSSSRTQNVNSLTKYVILAAVSAMASGNALATTFTRTSPTSGGAIPAGATEVGGIVLDLVGTNGVRVVSQLSAASLFSGFASSEPQTIGTQTGFTPTVYNALGGGISQMAVRITLSDGDTALGDFDYVQNTLVVNGQSIANFSSVPTQETSNDGLTLLSSNPVGGFRDGLLDTGWFYTNNATVLASVFSGITSTQQVVFRLSDLSPGDNFYDFTRGVAGGLINVGAAPNVSPVAEANGPYVATLTDLVTLSSSGSFDPDASPNSLIYEWDLDNDGTYDVSGASFTYSPALYYGPAFASYTVGLRVFDGLAYGYDTTTVSIVPEPASLGLLTGVVGVALRRRRAS